LPVPGLREGVEEARIGVSRILVLEDVEQTIERSPLTGACSLEKDATPAQPCSDWVQDLRRKVGITATPDLPNRVEDLSLTIAKAVQFDNGSRFLRPLVVEPPTHSNVPQVIG
jgi:hypothetical protein